MFLFKSRFVYYFCLQSKIQCVSVYKKSQRSCPTLLHKQTLLHIQRSPLLSFTFQIDFESYSKALHIPTEKQHYLSFLKTLVFMKRISTPSFIHSFIHTNKFSESTWRQLKRSYTILFLSISNSDRSRHIPNEKLKMPLLIKVQKYLKWKYMYLLYLHVSFENISLITTIF